MAAIVKQFFSLPIVGVYSQNFLYAVVFFFKVEVTVGYALLQYVPCGLFERFSVLCHRHEPNDFHHWQNGFYMKFGDVLIQSKVMSEKKCGDLKVSGRAPRNLLDNLWKILLTLLEVHLKYICFTSSFNLSRLEGWGKNLTLGPRNSIIYFILFYVGPHFCWGLCQYALFVPSPPPFPLWGALRMTTRILLVKWTILRPS